MVGEIDLANVSPATESASHRAILSSRNSAFTIAW